MTTRARLPLSRACCALGLLLLAGCAVDTAAPRLVASLDAITVPPPVARAGAVLRDTMRVRVTDQDGIGLPGVTVRWSVEPNLPGAAIRVLDSISDAGGLSAAIWTLGRAYGPQTLTATTLELPAVHFRTDADAFVADSVAVGTNYACGLQSAALWCWGYFPTALVQVAPPAMGAVDPVRFDSGHTYRALAVSESGVCALDDAATVRCLDGWTPGAFAAVPGLPAMRQLSAAPRQFCGAAVDSTAWRWTTSLSSNLPQITAVPGGMRFTQVIAGGYFGTSLFACGLRADSTAACWGDGREGQLGDGNGASSATPVAVAGGLRFAQLGLGTSSTCGRTATGAIYCWGHNDVDDLRWYPGYQVQTPQLAPIAGPRMAVGRNFLLVPGGAGVRYWGWALRGPLQLPGLPPTAYADLRAGGGICLVTPTRRVECDRLVSGHRTVDDFAIAFFAVTPAGP